MLRLKDFRDKAAGLPDLMNYAALMDEGIVQGKDGSLMAGFTFRGKDPASSSDSDMDYVTALVATYLSRFGSGWAMWVDAARIPSPGYPSRDKSHFPDVITTLIDEERREMFERQDTHYETEYVLILQYLPPLQRESRFGELMYSDDGRIGTSLGDRLLAEFKKKIGDFQEGLGGILHMHRLGSIVAGAADDQYESDELVNYLHFAITGEKIELRIPDCPMYLDIWLGIPDLWPGDRPQLGDKFIACVAIGGYPSNSYPGILSVFEELQVSFRWSSRFIFLEKHEAVSDLKKYHRVWTQNIRGFWQQLVKSSKGIVNLDSEKMADQVQDSIGVAESDVVKFGYYTPVVVLTGKDLPLLEAQAGYVAKAIEHKGFAARVESINTVDAWLGTLPGHTYPNVRRPLIHTLNLADLLPLSSIWPGLKENPCAFYPDNSPPLMHAVTTGATPFRVHLHDGDVAHTTIFGPTGAGKSVLLGMIAAQSTRFRSRPRPDGTTAPATITVFDKGRSMYALCSAVGGTHYDIGSDDADDLVLCPLVEIDSRSDSAWVEEWLGICYQLESEHNAPLTPDQKNEVHCAISLMRENPRHMRTFTKFLSLVQDKRVQGAFAPYAVRGGMGHLFDGKEETLKLSNFTVFEIDELMKFGDKTAIPVLLYLFRKFENSLTGQPAFLLLDEAWVMLGHPVFREKLRGWLKELRRKNCAVILATQSLSDAVRSGLLDVLLEQCPTKIFLPNTEADSYGTAETPGPAQLYKIFGLSDKEIAMLKTAQYKKQYYFRSPQGRRLFELGLGPLALSFVGVSDKDALRELKSYRAKYGDDWPIYWLKKNGVDYAKYTKQDDSSRLSLLAS